MKGIPFLPISEESAKRIAHHYIGWGEALSKFFPSLESDLEISEIRMESRYWLGIAFYSFIVYFLVLFVSLFLLFIISGTVFRVALGVSFLIGFMVGGVVFMYFVYFPKLRARKRVKDIENNLPFALRHILIQIRSGVTLFSAMVSVGWSGYGMLSEEFKKAVNEINTGKSEIAALEKIAHDNPSLFFRRILWQMINAMKSGSDIGNVLKSIVENITAEQRVAIKRYGAQLNPMALFYMMLVVIFPTLGIVFLLILFSFVGSAINIELILMGILAFLAFVQVMFIGMVKSKRPGGI